jgi:WD40 repeat protein
MTGKRFIGGYQDKYLVLYSLYWHGKDKRWIIELYDLIDGKFVSKVAMLGESCSIMDPEPLICFTHQQKVIIYNCISNDMVCERELEHSGRIYSTWPYYQDGSFRLLVDCETSLQMLQVDLKGEYIGDIWFTEKHFSGQCKTTTLDDSRNMLITGGDDGQIHIWNYLTGQHIRDIKIKMDCSGANIEGVQGLTAKSVDWLRERGAVGTPGSILPESEPVYYVADNISFGRYQLNAETL